MKAVHTTQAPAAIGPYSQAIEVNGFVFASGQIPIDPATGEFVEGGIQEQTRQALTNASNILKQAGTDLAHVVKTTVFLSSITDFAAMNLCTVLYRTLSCPQRCGSERPSQGRLG